MEKTLAEMQKKWRREDIQRDKERRNFLIQESLPLHLRMAKLHKDEPKRRTFLLENYFKRLRELREINKRLGIE